MAVFPLLSLLQQQQQQLLLQNVRALMLTGEKREGDRQKNSPIYNPTYRSCLRKLTINSPFSVFLIKLFLTKVKNLTTTSLLNERLILIRKCQFEQKSKKIDNKRDD